MGQDPGVRIIHQAQFQLAILVSSQTELALNLAITNHPPPTHLPTYPGK